MKRGLFILVILFLLPLVTYSQSQFAISGKVIDEEKLLLSGASVKLMDKNDSAVYVTQSDEDGVFHLNSIQAGKYKLLVTMIGRISQNKSITIKGKDISNLEIILPFDYKNTLPEANITANRKQIKVAKFRLQYRELSKKQQQKADINLTSKDFTKTLIFHDNNYEYNRHYIQ